MASRGTHDHFPFSSPRLRFFEVAALKESKDCTEKTAVSAKEPRRHASPKALATRGQKEVAQPVFGSGMLVLGHGASIETKLEASRLRV